MKSKHCCFEIVTIGGELWVNEEEGGLQYGLHGLQHIHISIRGTVTGVHPNDIGQFLELMKWAGFN